MSRRRRNRTPLQSIAIFTVCALFVLTALVGLYKCFSQPPTLPSQDQQGDTTDDSQQEDSALAPDSSENTAAANGRKDDFFTILVSGLDDENITTAYIFINLYADFAIAKATYSGVAE